MASIAAEWRRREVPGVGYVEHPVGGGGAIRLLCRSK